MFNYRQVFFIKFYYYFYFRFFIKFTSKYSEVFSSSAKSMNHFSAADLECIKEMFPTFDTEIITSILESKNGNKDATIETLLQMVADS